MQTHAPEIAHDNQSSSHGSPAQHTGAPTETHLPNSDPASNENDDLIFDSHDDAVAERERLFRQPLERIDGDDVEEVDQHKREYAVAILKALKHKDFLPPPETKKIRPPKGAGDKAKKTAADLTVSLSEVDRTKWLRWQKDAQQIVKSHLDQPKRKADTAFGHCAWDIVNEVIKIHRQGFFFTNQKKDQTLKCSARIEGAIQVIKEYARVRAKLLDGDKISNFCISPQAYAKVTLNAFWNNSGRAKAPVKDSVPSQRVTKNNGALAGRYGEDKKSKKPAKTKGSGAVGTGSGVEQEVTSAVSSEDGASALSPVDDEEGLEGLEGGEDEDADGEIDDDAIADPWSDPNALSAFNNGGSGGISFGDVPGHPSMRRFSHVDNTYSANIGENPTATDHFHQLYQTTARGLTTHAFGLQAANAPMLPASGSGDPTSTGAIHPSQHNMYSPHLLPAPVRHLDNNFGYTPTTYMYSSAGFSNPQASQSDVGEARTGKRRKLER